MRKIVYFFLVFKFKFHIKTPEVCPTSGVHFKRSVFGYFRFLICLCKSHLSSQTPTRTGRRLLSIYFRKYSRISQKKTSHQFFTDARSIGFSVCFLYPAWLISFALFRIILFASEHYPLFEFYKRVNTISEVFIIKLIYHVFFYQALHFSRPRPSAV